MISSSTLPEESSNMHIILILEFMGDERVYSVAGINGTGSHGDPKFITEINS